MLIKAGIGGPLESIGSLSRYTAGFRFDATLKRVFGADRMGFYKTILDSVEDYKRYKVMEAKLDASKIVAKAFKDELAEMVSKIREQMAILGAERTRTTLSSIKEVDNTRAKLTQLHSDISSVSVDPLTPNHFKSVTKKNKGGASTTSEGELTHYLTGASSRELIKRFLKAERPREDVLTDIQVELDKLSNTSGDVSAVSDAVKSSVATIQSYLAAASVHLKKKAAIGKPPGALDVAPPPADAKENGISMDSFGRDLDWPTFFEQAGKGIDHFATEAQLTLDTHAPPPASALTSTTTLVDHLNRYRRSVDEVLRYLTLTAPKEVDDALSLARKDIKDKNPFAFGDGISATQVYRIYNAHKWDRERKKEVMNELAFNLAQLVRYMEYARDDYKRAARRVEEADPASASAEAANALREDEERMRAARKEFEYECGRIQKKINKEMMDYPEVREMYFKICAPLNQDAPA